MSAFRRIMVAACRSIAALYGRQCEEYSDRVVVRGGLHDHIAPVVAWTVGYVGGTVHMRIEDVSTREIAYYFYKKLPSKEKIAETRYIRLYSVNEANKGRLILSPPLTDFESEKFVKLCLHLPGGGDGIVSMTRRVRGDTVYLEVSVRGMRYISLNDFLILLIRGERNRWGVKK